MSLTSNYLAESRGSNFSINTSHSPDCAGGIDRLASSVSTEFSVYTEAVESTITLTGFGKDRVFELEELRVFKCVLFTNWDNIVGPQVSKCWLRPGVEGSEQLVNYVNMHVLTGDMDESNHSSRDRERKLLFIPEKNVIIMAIVFNTSSRASRAKLMCLSLVFPLESPEYASKVTDLYSFLYKSCGTLKDAFKDSTVSSQKLNEHLGRLIIKLDSTVYNLMNYSLVQVSYPLQYFGDGTNSEACSFLKQVYQAVLQCAGFSVVTGNRRHWMQMEQMTLLISYIIPVTEKCVSICPTENHTEFSNHVFLQTIVYDRDEEADEVLLGVYNLRTYGNRFPLAIIDVTKNTVKVTASLEVFSNKQLKDNNIDGWGKFVDKIVTKMMKFGKSTEFLVRLGALAMDEITCKADLFKKLYAEEMNFNATKKLLKWHPHDLNIFVAWACRVDPELKKHLYIKDSPFNPEQSEFLPVLGRPMIVRL